MTNDLHHIYYIDDDADILAVVKFALEKIGGYTVTTCVEAKQALIQLEKEQPDLIMLDVMMPDMDGPTLLSHLRTYPNLKHVPVVLITALVQDADMARLTQMDVAGVLHKPSNTMALPETIRIFWRKHHNQSASSDAHIPDDLKREYLKTLSLYHNQIATFLMQCEQNTASRTEMENIAQLAHKLAGSGATYGYPNISATARNLKDCIHHQADANIIIPCAQLFLHSLDEAFEARVSS